MIRKHKKMYGNPGELKTPLARKKAKDEGLPMKTLKLTDTEEEEKQLQALLAAWDGPKKTVPKDLERYLLKSLVHFLLLWSGTEEQMRSFRATSGKNPLYLEHIRGRNGKGAYVLWYDKKKGRLLVGKNSTGDKVHWELELKLCK